MAESQTERIEAFVERLSADDLIRTVLDWPIWCHSAQRPPLRRWRSWLLLGGRGAGKTRAGAQWLKALVEQDAHFEGDAAGHVALVGENYAEVRHVMIEGESGILAIHPRSARPEWSPSLRKLTWPNGTTGRIFSAADPDGLRGGQFGAAWCDELAKWPYLQESWDMLQFCLRLGKDPKVMATTTPRPLPLIKALVGDPQTAVTRSPTKANIAHLARGFVEFLDSAYGGSRLGRQEIDGEIIEDREDALWRRDLLEAGRCAAPESLRRIVVAVDPPAGSGASSAACGIVAAGVAENGICYVLADRTIHSASPMEWADAAISLYRELEADALIAETNQGGEMVKAVVGGVDPNVPVRGVRATRSKWIRAEPVALLYEQGKVRHAARLAALEDQMCAFARDGTAEGVSPDRVDALVWAISDLMLGARARPRIRSA